MQHTSMPTPDSPPIDPLHPADPLDETIRAALARSVALAASAPSASDSLARLKQERLTQEPRVVTSTQKPSRRASASFATAGWLQRSRRRGFVAVVTIAMAILAVGVIQTVRPSATQTVQATTAYHTAIGQRADIQLPDGSRVMLAPATKLRYLMTSRARTVTLDGEAYFEIAPTHQTPFVVEARGVATQVLGTSFGIRAYATDSVQVMVASGKVAVRPSAHTDRGRRATIVTPGMSVAVMGDRVVAGSVTSVPDALSWTTGRLVFNDTPFSTVLNDLARWYGVEVAVATPALGARRLSGTLRTDAGANTALHFVASALDVRYETHGHRIVFTDR